MGGRQVFKFFPLYTHLFLHILFSVSHMKSTCEIEIPWSFLSAKFSVCQTPPAPVDFKPLFPMPIFTLLIFFKVKKKVGKICNEIGFQE